MGGVRVGSVVIDCNDFGRMFAFWRDALGYVPRDELEDDWVVLQDPSGSNVNVSLQVVPEPRVGKNRLHLDLYAEDRDAEIARIVGLGATIHPRTPEPDEDFIVLADPEGTCSASSRRTAEGVRGSMSPRRSASRNSSTTHATTACALDRTARWSRERTPRPPRTGYIASKASYTVTLPPPCRTGEPFARPVAAWSESAWTIV